VSVPAIWLEPRTWEALRVELGDRAACAIDSEERWGVGSAVLRLEEANDARDDHVVVVPQFDAAVVTDAAQKTPR
jgi:hypothetical protein